MRTIDIVGVVTTVGDSAEINLKNGGSRVKRNVTLADNSAAGGMSITMVRRALLTSAQCFWGDKADAYEFQVGHVMALKSVRVSDFNGKSLNSSEDTQVLFDPPISQTKALQEWYQTVSDPDSIPRISQSGALEDRKSSNDSQRVRYLLWSERASAACCGNEHPHSRGRP